MRLRLCFLTAAGLGIHGIAQSAEPLAGPIIGGQWWTYPSHQNKYDDNQVVERFLEVDAPIPIAAGISMPFITMRYRDIKLSHSRTSSQDERIGVGFLHHAAEGDPAWRADFTRIGRIDHEPAFHSRLLMNLIKPLPWLKLRPSDQVLSWIGLNYVSRGKVRAPFVIPEFCWNRQGSEGLILDINAPRHVFLGLHRANIKVTLGLEQDWVQWQTESESDSDSWILRQRSRANFAWMPSREWTVTTGILHDLKTENSRDNLGVEFSLRWTPGP